MADKVLPDEVIVTSMANSDYIVIVIGGNQRRILKSDFESLITASGLLGEATPGSVPVSTNGFYTAATAGTYTNFSGLVVTTNELCLLSHNGTSWQKDTIRLLVHNDLGNRNLANSHTVAAIQWVYGAENMPLTNKIVEIQDDIIQLYSDDTDIYTYFNAKLDTFKVATSFSAESKRLQNLADPLNNQDAATKAYVLNFSTGDAQGQGLAELTTTPISSPDAGDWYWAKETGTYTNFGITGNAGARLIYDGSAWVNVLQDCPQNYTASATTIPAATPTTITHNKGKMVTRAIYVLLSLILWCIRNRISELLCSVCRINGSTDLHIKYNSTIDVL